LIARRPLVQDQPVKSQLPDGIHEMLKIERFADIAVGAQPVAVHDVLLLLGGSQNNHERMLLLGSVPHGVVLRD
jgi:hypothetical protein